MERIVRVEAVHVERVADPGPPDGDEEPGEDEEAMDARVFGETVGQLGDRDNEDEIEEELEPGRVALVLPSSSSARSRGGSCQRDVDAISAATPHRRRRIPASEYLSSLEVRLALLRERGQPLAGVLGREREVERLALGVEAGLEGRLERPVDGLFGQARATGLFAAIARATAFASSSQASLATTRATSPARSASSAVRKRPERITSIAFALPIARVRRCVPPAPGMIRARSRAGRSARSPRRR